MRFQRTTFRPRTIAALAAGVGLAASAAVAVPAAAADAEFSKAEVASVKSAVAESAPVGSSWYTDPATNKVVITVDETVSAAEIAEVKEAAAEKTSQGDEAVTVKHTKGEFSPLIGGGDAIYGGGSRCSLGFNVKVGGADYFLTAGHCTNAVSTWYANSSSTTLLGIDRGLELPGQRLRHRPLQLDASRTVGGGHHRGHPLRRPERHPRRLDHRYPQRHRDGGQRQRPLRRGNRERHDPDQRVRGAR